MTKHMLGQHATRKAGDLDRYVASKIKKRRRELEITQQELADRLGVTFQQVQKYENSENRLSAGRVFEIAQIFDVPVSYFFPTPNSPNSASTPPELDEFLASYCSLSERWQEVLRALAAELPKTKD